MVARIFQGLYYISYNVQHCQVDWKNTVLYRKCLKVDYMMMPTSFTCNLLDMHVYAYIHLNYSDCLGFCFMHLVHKDLDRVRTEWNCHRIRHSRQSCCPSGFPNELYQLPQISGSYGLLIACMDDNIMLIDFNALNAGTKDYSFPVDSRDVTVVMEYTEEPDPPGSLEFLELVSQIMNQYNLHMPSTVQEALDTFVVLTTVIENDIDTLQ